MAKLMEEFKKNTTMEMPDPQDIAKEKEAAPDYFAIDKPIAEAVGENMYPCLLAMCGSAFGFMKVGVHCQKEFLYHVKSKKGI